MELNIRTITILINALKIAKEISQITYSEKILNTLVPGSQPNRVFLKNQTVLIESLEEYEKLIDDFRELLTKQRNLSKKKPMIK